MGAIQDYLLKKQKEAGRQAKLKEANEGISRAIAEDTNRMLSLDSDHYLIGDEISTFGIMGKEKVNNELRGPEVLLPGEKEVVAGGGGERVG